MAYSIKIGSIRDDYRIIYEENDNNPKKLVIEGELVLKKSGLFKSINEEYIIYIDEITYWDFPEKEIITTKELKKILIRLSSYLKQNNINMLLK